jgi:enoyl-CoA hydratase
MSEEKKLTVDREGHVLMMGLNRPAKRNAFDVDLFEQLSLAYGELAQDSDLRVGVVYAHGDHFTGGLDLPQWTPLFEQGKFSSVPAGGIDPLGLGDDRITKPIVLATQGWCLTIGIELLLATDIRVASQDTRFAQIEIKRGIYPVGGATIRLQREIGWANAMRYLLTGDEFSAEEAYRLGLVQEVVAPGQQVERTLSIAQTIARQAPLGVYATLKSARLAISDSERRAIDALMPDLMPLMQSDDVKEGVQSFIERREAVFTGK